jgi:hypothetical protein
VWTVSPSSFFWGERAWKGVPEPNTGQKVTLTAVFSIQPSDIAREHAVWTGRAISAPIKALLVDPRLRTPHEYLLEQCPKQALKMIQADRTWMTKRDEQQCTPLHHAARFGFVEVVRWMLANGADVNARGPNQCTPLHVAAVCNQGKMVRFLLDEGADRDARTKKGQTPLDLVEKKRGSEPVADMLRGRK